MEKPNNNKAKVLFVCIENSCRSQMAEGFAKRYGGDVIEAWSAGSRPSRMINETAIKVMHEKGISIAWQRSKSLEDLPGIKWDYIVSMGCEDQCPLVPSIEKIDWKVPDPKMFPLEGFREARNEIERRILALIQKITHRMIG